MSFCQPLSPHRSLRSSVLPPQLPLLFPFSLRGLSGLPPPTLKAATLPLLEQHPAICHGLLSTSFSVCLALLPLRPHRFSQSPVVALRVLAWEYVLGPCPLSLPQPFLPCFFPFQSVLSLLLATHQLHPHHLSKWFAYSLLITFPAFRQELPGSWLSHVLLPCFPYSCHAHSFPTGCLWGSNHHSLQSLDPTGSLPSEVWLLSPWASCLSL